MPDAIYKVLSPHGPCTEGVPEHDTWKTCEPAADCRIASGIAAQERAHCSALRSTAHHCHPHEDGWVLTHFKCFAFSNACLAASLPIPWLFVSDAPSCDAAFCATVCSLHHCIIIHLLPCVSHCSSLRAAECLQMRCKKILSFFVFHRIDLWQGRRCGSRSGFRLAGWQFLEVSCQGL